uniref:Cysteine-rich venom protein ablomin-like n=1 Tax=Geotrypetes seraphini TaxID=260995 RepID=A0A6P8QD49_GEOSA|nr:cysteine-rich venom protein ablomin-like [Geotrypetes seraphini]
MTLLIFTVCSAAIVYQTTGQNSVTYNSVLTNSTDNQNDIVNEHNSIRRQVNPTASNMQKMRWNSTIADNAQRWAEACTGDHSQPSDRLINGYPCGENLYASTICTSWKTAIGFWENEHNNFEYGKGPEPSNAIVGHYTQITWDQSRDVGCGVAYCPNATYKCQYVCQYFEHGNEINRLYTPYKNGTQCADCPNACDSGLCLPDT